MSLAASGPALAARPATAAPVISTIAGGPGGPGLATKLTLFPGCALASGGGSVYLSVNNSGAGTIRKISTSNDQLTTPAGSGDGGPVGAGGPATDAAFSGCGVAVDPGGDLSIANSGTQINSTVYGDLAEFVPATAGTYFGQVMKAKHIYTVAGDGVKGFSGDGGPGTSAEINIPGGMAFDSAGNLVFADTQNDRVRVVADQTGTFFGQAMTAGNIYTVAGDGTAAFSGDGGPATSAGVQPGSVTVDSAGNLVVSDGSNRIRVVAARTGMFYGQAMTAGNIYTVAGDGTAGDSGDGGPAVSAELNNPGQVAVDASGNLVVGDVGSNRVRVVAVTSGTFYGQAMTAGNIYTIAGQGTAYPGDGGPATAAAVTGPDGVAVDASGNVVVTDNAYIQVIAEHTGHYYGQAMTAGNIYTMAGNGTGYTETGTGGLATSAQINPAAVTTDSAGNVLLSDNDGQLRVVARATGSFYGVAMTAGHLYTVAGGGSNPVTDGAAATSVDLDGPWAMAVDGAGNVVMSCAYEMVVLAAKTGAFYGQAMTAGDVYIIAGTGSSGDSGNGGPATSAELGDATGVALDQHGNVVIADNGNYLVRVVAEQTGMFYGQAMTAGDIYNVAGGLKGTDPGGKPALGAKFEALVSVAVDTHGNLVVDDLKNQRVYLVAESTATFYGQAMTAGYLYDIAGDAHIGAGGSGLGWKTSLYYPADAAVDSYGNVLIANSHADEIRVLAGSTGTFYAQKMTAGHIYTVAGVADDDGYNGDGGPAAQAWLGNPSGVSPDGAGNLVIADSGNSRVREITG